jgi:hypothetical protein
MVVDKKITGGSRVVQTFGDFYSNVRFSGRFWENADSRVALMTQIRQSGIEQLITWRSQRFYGIVIDFVPKYKNGFDCPFEIELIITRHATSGKSNAAPSPSNLDQVVSTATANALTMLGAIGAIDPGAAAAGINASLLTELNQQIATAGPLASVVGTSTGAQILASVGTAQATVSAYQASLTSLSPSYVPATMLYNSLALISRNIQQGQSPTTVRTMGGSYFDQAVLQYGDIDLGISLADANNAPSMILPGMSLTTIVVPPLQAAA